MHYFYLQQLLFTVVESLFLSEADICFVVCFWQMMPSMNSVVILFYLALFNKGILGSLKMGFELFLQTFVNI